jgi:hypothetical protein
MTCVAPPGRVVSKRAENPRLPKNLSSIENTIGRHARFGRTGGRTGPGKDLSHRHAKHDSVKTGAFDSRVARRGQGRYDRPLCERHSIGRGALCKVKVVPMEAIMIAVTPPACNVVKVWCRKVNPMTAPIAGSALVRVP